MEGGGETLGDMEGGEEDSFEHLEGVMICLWRFTCLERQYDCVMGLVSSHGEYGMYDYLGMYKNDCMDDMNVINYLVKNERKTKRSQVEAHFFPPEH